MSHDTVVRDAYLHGRDEVVDIAVDDGLIEAVDEVDTEGAAELDAEGNLVSPGLVDAHAHYDWAFSSGGGRRPAGNDEPYDQNRNTRRLRSFMESVTPDEIAGSVRAAARTAVTNGTLHARTHAYVDADVGTTDIGAVLAVREELDPTFDLQVVSFPQEGYVGNPETRAATREALELGADYVGGIDPGSVNEDVEGAIAHWFDLAAEYDVGIDAHLHDPGSLGRFTLGQYAEAAIEHGYEDRVTASHVYALGDSARDTARFPQGDLDYVLGLVGDARMSLVTCYMTTPTEMPIAAIQDHGIAIGHGTDQIQDLWYAHGNSNVVQGALVESLKLQGDRDYASNPGLRALWDVLTTESASVLGLEGYGIEEGTPANLVVHDEPSPEWVIIRQSTPRCVLSDGTVVAREGELTVPFADGE